MEPATGASTWALGSQRCTINKGNLTRKAVVTIIQAKRGIIDCGKMIHGYTIDVWEDRLEILDRISNKGREAVTV